MTPKKTKRKCPDILIKKILDGDQIKQKASNVVERIHLCTPTIKAGDKEVHLLLRCHFVLARCWLSPAHQPLRPGNSSLWPIEITASTRTFDEILKLPYTIH